MDEIKHIKGKLAPPGTKPRRTESARIAQLEAQVEGLRAALKTAKQGFNAVWRHCAAAAPAYWKVGRAVEISADCLRDIDTVLSATPGPRRVKKLVWTKEPSHPNVFYANVAGTSYRTGKINDGYSWWYGQDWMGAEASMQDAKAAAQSHFEGLVSQCLETDHE